MPFFSDETVRLVREASDLVQVIEARGIPLRRAGANLLGLCPFHREKTPSFNVRPAEQFFRCFGCDAKGDVITFVMRHDRLDFPSAVAELARAAGIPVASADPGEQRRQSREAARRDAMHWTLDKALAWFEDHLARPRDGGMEAKRYLLDRGFTEATVRGWRLGWAPDRFDGLVRHLTEGIADADRRRLMLEYATASGLLRRKTDEHTGAVRYYDAFRGRVMFPILDVRRRPAGFGGRVLVESERNPGKYINSSEGKLFEKRKILFGLPQASRSIGERGEAVVVEGYTDTIMCHQYGLENVVATLGTALTKEHIGQLRRHIGPQGRVIVFFDNDKAGEAATDRAIRLFWEEDVALAVARGLALKDACAFLPQYGVDAFRTQLDQAESSFNYILKKTVGAARGLDVPARAAAAKEAADLVNLSPDPIKRAYMRKALAAEAGVPENVLPPEPETPVAPMATMVTPGGVPGRRDSGRLAPRGGRPAGWNAGGVRPAPSGDAGTSGMDVLTAALAGAARERRKRYDRLLVHMWANAHWAERIAHELPPDEINDAACAEVAALIRDAWQAGVAPKVAALMPRCAREGAVELVIDLGTGPEQTALAPSEAELAALLDWVNRDRVELRLKEATDELREAQKADDVAGIDALLREIIELRKRLK